MAPTRLGAYPTRSWKTPGRQGDGALPPILPTPPAYTCISPASDGVVVSSSAACGSTACPASSESSRERFLEPSCGMRNSAAGANAFSALIKALSSCGKQNHLLHSTYTTGSGGTIREWATKRLTSSAAPSCGAASTSIAASAGPAASLAGAAASAAAAGA